MITLTIQEVRDSMEKTQWHCVYVYRDKDTYLYIGRSVHPCERLREHLGETTSYPLSDSVGDIIIDNMPESLHWTVEIWALQELRPDLYQEALKTDKLDQLVNDLEEYLIGHFKPHLNVLGRNYRNPLPDRYIKRKIANKGVNLA